MYNMVLSVTVTFFVSSCYFLRAICAEIAHVLKEIDGMCSGRNTKAIASRVQRKMKYVILLDMKLTE